MSLAFAFFVLYYGNYPFVRTKKLASGNDKTNRKARKRDDRWKWNLQHVLKYGVRMLISSDVSLVGKLFVQFVALIFLNPGIQVGKATETMQNPLRLIEAEDSGGRPVVHRFWQGKKSQISRYRWKIKPLFKWIKQHMVIKHFYGHGEQSVQNQIYIGPITYCLLTLFRMTTKTRSK